jgi:hypothetical protein
LQYIKDGAPLEEEAVQYYRASSVVLTIDGYNNTAIFSPGDTTPDAPLPTTVDTNMLKCMNETIAEFVPLISNAAVGGRMLSGNLGLVLVFWSIVRAFSWI